MRSWPRFRYLRRPPGAPRYSRLLMNSESGTETGKQGYLPHQEYVSIEIAASRQCWHADRMKLSNGSRGQTGGARPCRRAVCYVTHSDGNHPLDIRGLIRDIETPHLVGATPTTRHGRMSAPSSSEPGSASKRVRTMLCPTSRRSCLTQPATRPTWREAPSLSPTLPQSRAAPSNHRRCRRI